MTLSIRVHCDEPGCRATAVARIDCYSDPPWRADGWQHWFGEQFGAVRDYCPQHAGLPTRNKVN